MVIETVFPAMLIEGEGRGQVNSMGEFSSIQEGRVLIFVGDVIFREGGRRMRRGACLVNKF